MEDQTPNLSLPFIMPSQAQKHVTHNEAIRRLDILTQMVVENRAISMPPQSPQNGSAYLVPENATEEWEGRQNQIAAYQDGAFIYLTPREGWRVYAKEQGFFVFNGDEWVSFEGASVDLSDIDILGVNTQADETNRLAVRSNAVLMTHETDDIRAIINKGAAADTASVLFQNGFSARAEIGLTGDDDFHFSVSANGSDFKDSIVLEKETGVARFPKGFERNGISSETLTAAVAQVSTLSGPAAIRFDADAMRLGWQGRFISIANGNGIHFSTDGLFEITQPPAGTQITDASGTVLDIVTESGLHLAEWDALYYVLPIGQGGASQILNFRKVNYNQPFAFPAHEVWTFLALRNGDTGEIRLGNGETIYASDHFVNRHEDQNSTNSHPAFHAYDLDVFNGAESLIFKDVQLDNGQNYDPTTGRFTAPFAGTYNFLAHILIGNSNPRGTVFRILFRKNGTNIASGRATSLTLPSDNQFHPLYGSTLVNLEPGDTVECYVTGGNIWTGHDLNHFSGYLVSKS